MVSQSNNVSDKMELRDESAGEYRSSLKKVCKGIRNKEVESENRKIQG